MSLIDVNHCTHDYVLVENNSKTDGIDSFHCQENGLKWSITVNELKNSTTVDWDGFVCKTRDSTFVFITVNGSAGGGNKTQSSMLNFSTQLVKQTVRWEIRCFPLFIFIFTELQTAVCVHRYPASSAQHRQRLLEAGAGLSLHVYSDAERRGSRAGETHTHTPELSLQDQRHATRHRLKQQMHVTAVVRPSHMHCSDMK